MPAITAQDRKSLVNRKLFAIDPNHRGTFLGSHYVVISCGPKITKLANITFGTVEQRGSWHHDVRTADLFADLRGESNREGAYRFATDTDNTYAPTR